MRASALVVAAFAIHSYAADVRSLTLKAAVELALKQNADIVLARLDELKANEAVREARDPFTPRLVVGSGLAYTYGFPMSIEGSAPSIVQARAIQSLYNKPLSFRVAAARENARGAALDTAARRDEVIYRVAGMHFAASRARRIAELAAQQVPAFEKIADSVRARVEEGRELPVEARAAELRVAQARQRVRALESERDTAERALGVALGLDTGERVVAAESEPGVTALPGSEDEAAEKAITNSAELRRLHSAMQVRQLEAQSARASRWPQVDLVAQYALMGRFNNYEDFFRRFQRHNGQLGMSFQLPLFAGSAASAQAAQAQIEIEKLRKQMDATRARLGHDARQGMQQLRVSEMARDVAKMDLDVTRERLSVGLAQFEEGRLGLRQVEELRSAEMEKWLAFYDAQHAVERARVDLLRATGQLTASLQ